jgi:hypothetical protein
MTSQFAKSVLAEPENIRHISIDSDQLLATKNYIHS